MGRAPEHIPTYMQETLMQLRLSLLSSDLYDTLHQSDSLMHIIELKGKFEI